MVVRLVIMVRLVMQGLCAASTKISQSCKRCGQPSDLLLLQAVWMRRNSRMTQPKPITTYQPIIANLTTYHSVVGFFARLDRLYHPRSFSCVGRTSSSHNSTHQNTLGNCEPYLRERPSY